MGKFIDLTGKRFGRLTVIKRDKDHIEPSGRKRVMWLCKCDCDNEITIPSNSLNVKHTLSCGCYNKEVVKKINTVHGMHKTRIYYIWQNMKSRCLNKDNKRYKDYGGRGIKVCDEWSNDFIKFYNWAITNGYKDSLTIDRKDVNGNYEPDNCKWSTIQEQNNNKRNNRKVSFNGETLTITQMAEKYNLKFDTLQGRLDSGWSIERAILTPVKA